MTAVLFDLDGTLLDTAPDMANALNALRAEQNLSPLPYAAIRPFVSHGATAMVRLGFPDLPEEPFNVLRQRFLEIYRSRLAEDTRLIAGGSCDEEDALVISHKSEVTSRKSEVTSRKS